MAKRSKGVSIQVERWMKQAQHDLLAARKNFEIEFYDVSLVMCQQALEKALKAFYISQTGSTPPKTHSIDLLAAKTHMRAELDDALVELEDFYIRLRYPEYAAEDQITLPFELATRDDAQRDIQLTQNALDKIQMEIDRAKE